MSRDLDENEENMFQETHYTLHTNPSPPPLYFPLRLFSRVPFVSRPRSQNHGNSSIGHFNGINGRGFLGKGNLESL